MADDYTPAEGAEADVMQRRPDPHAPWQCGYQPLGFGCEDGPTANGVCCQLDAVKRRGFKKCEAGDCERGCSGSDSCEVARLRRAAALPSHESLGPCIPRRSFWHSRQNLALNTAILAGGILLLCMALPQREATFAPGELSNKHAQILGNRLISERCSLCHPNAHPSRFRSITQDELCMQCHESHLPDAVLQSPHDLSADSLARIARPANTPTGRATLLKMLGSGNNNLSTRCATCHIEHHGSHSNINAITDARCQACHQTQFSSFASGHPQFGGYPYRTVSRIQFDHAAHAERHFATQHEVFDCSRCHVDQSRKGTVGSVFRNVGFENACGSCHTEPIRASTVNGWALLQLPSLLPEDAENSEYGLSDWPQAACFGYDGEISVATRLLLASDGQLADALARVPASGKLAEIEPKLRPELVRILARAFRAMIAEVARDGQAAWQRRLKAAIANRRQREPNAHELALIQEICFGLPPDLFRQMERDWFGGKEELADLGPGQAVRSAANQATPAVKQVVESMRGSRRPGDITQSSPSARLSLASSPVQVDQTLDDELLEEVQLPANGSDDLLGDASEDDLLRGEFELGAGNAPKLNGGGDPPAKDRLVRLRGATHVANGGWYLDNSLLALRYMPRGHGDKTLAAWHELAEIIEGHPGGNQTGESHGEATTTSTATVPGGCLECHSLGRESAPREPWSNWRSLQRPETIRLFTKFNHTPHLTLPTLSDCRYCHVLREADGPKVNSVSAAVGLDDSSSGLIGNANSRYSQTQAHAESEFSQMQLNQCVVCHRPGGADDGCTQCHNYHVGQSGFNWSRQSPGTP